MYDSSIAKNFKLVPLRLNNTIWAGPFRATVWGPVQVKITGIAVLCFSVVLVLVPFRLNKRVFERPSFPPPHLKVQAGTWQQWIFLNLSNILTQSHHQIFVPFRLNKSPGLPD